MTGIAIRYFHPLYSSDTVFLAQTRVSRKGSASVAWRVVVFCGLDAS